MRSHGTYGRYNAGCRCDNCRWANARYEKFRVLRKTDGRMASEWAPGDEARRLIGILQERGVGIGRIIELTGTSRSRLHAIRHGCYPSHPDHPRHRAPAVRVRRDLVDQLAALVAQTPDSPAPTGTRAAGHHLPRHGTARRLRALCRLGWTGDELATRLGVHPQQVSHLQSETVTVGVTEATARAVRDLYEQLWNITPPDSYGARRARTRALRAGWPPPMAWDDETIDDPDTTPSGVRPDIEPSLRAPSGQSALRITELVDIGADLTDIQARLHLTRGSVYQTLHRAGLDAVWRQLTAPEATTATTADYRYRSIG